MIVIVAVDERNGMMFNKRRQSQDKALRERILEIAKGKALWMNRYTAKQFEDQGGIIVDDEFLDRAGTGEFCFVENTPVAPYLDRIEKIIRFCWNRKYPGDMIFDVDLTDGWELEETKEFEGNSHEKITEEVYVCKK